MAEQDTQRAQQFDPKWTNVCIFVQAVNLPPCIKGCNNPFNYPQSCLRIRLGETPKQPPQKPGRRESR